jgi:glycerol uptake facilitator-like aquaporin
MFRVAADEGERHRGERALSAPLPRRLLAEFLGSAFLTATVIGSGIAAAQLSPGDVGLQLLENAAAAAAGLFTFILMFGPVSGAHFNPVVSLVDASFGGLRWRHALAYIPPRCAAASRGRSPRTGCSRSRR